MTIGMKQQSFGLELEFTGITRKKAAQAIAQVINGNFEYDHIASYDRRIVKDTEGRRWSICSDVSVTGSRAGTGGEFVTPKCDYEDIATVQECIRALRRAGAKVNSSCGIHIHVDGANHNAKSLKNLLYTFRAKEDLIYKACGPGRQHNNYCKPIGDDLIGSIKKLRNVTDENLKDTWYKTLDPWNGDRNAHYNDSRYHGINLHSLWYRGSIEFRLFEATLHAGKVRAYINLCLAMSAAAINAKRASAEPLDNGNDKYAMRCWLLRLGFIGDEWKTVREHLLKNLDGNAAWRNDPNTYESYNNRNSRTA